MFPRLGVVLSIAFRNLFTGWLNLIIGLLILSGTVLLVTGGALMDSLDRGMSSSVTGSLAGDLQVYSSRSKDKLELFGGIAGADPDLAPMVDFVPIEKLLRENPNVKSVIPMGLHGAMLPSGNTIDLVLARLRDAVRAQAEGDRSAERRAQIQSLAEHVRHIAQILEQDLLHLRQLLTERAAGDRDAEAIHQAASEAFWQDFQKDPLAGLDFLENRVAPQLADGDLIYLRYVGTDPQRFESAFSRMQIVQGEAIPAGHRGFLFARESYENNFKLKVAWRLDQMKEARDTNQRSFVKDEELKRMSRENQSQTREIALQLDPQRTRTAIDRLQRALHSQQTELEPLLRELLDVNDENFDARYAIFYEQLAKDLLELYRVRVGDTLTLSAYTRGGYSRAVNLKVYGVYQFSGLEKSPLGGITSMMDLVSFRQLYGYLNTEHLAELQQLKAHAGAQDVKREDAEDALFGESHDLTATAKANVIDESQLIEKRGARDFAAEQTYAPADLEQGIVVNAAIFMNDPRKLPQTIAQLTDAAKRAGLEVSFITWQDASGIIGQFVRLARLALYIFVFILFAVTLVVINNAMMMATLQRIREIGTLRAIGAQRSFVLSLVCVETVMLGALFGGVGLLLGAGVMAFLHVHGVGAMSPQLYFFFSGPRLYPTLSASNLVAAFLIVLAVSLISTLYPALIATRVSPLQAMQSDE